MSWSTWFMNIFLMMLHMLGSGVRFRLFFEFSKEVKNHIPCFPFIFLSHVFKLRYEDKRRQQIHFWNLSYELLGNNRHVLLSYFFAKWVPILAFIIKSLSLFHYLVLYLVYHLSIALFETPWEYSLLYEANSLILNLSYLFSCDKWTIPQFHKFSWV
jgi:hypothetical protein